MIKLIISICTIFFLSACSSEGSSNSKLDSGKDLGNSKDSVELPPQVPIQE